MEKTLLSAKDLAERWGCSEGYINILEQDGVLTRVDLSKRLFPVSQIREIEKSEEPNPTLERVRKLTDENKRKRELEKEFGGDGQGYIWRILNASF